ncbi:MobH family relaxase [Pseudomonas sp. MWU13-3659]|uniref:MobH family relaxase n=1 Tax=Pseudomonas sp. MWU13-3659 TaxID=2986964 RepID=UPI0020765ABE|nr:MobH family relaxase [Pseudomonas sp. MWU13-3659]
MQLLSWLSRKAAKPTPEASPQGFHLPAKPAALLQSPLRQQLLENIWRRASLSRAQFNTLYRQPLERYAELVQLLPASENHHHAHLGGLLDHGLEIMAYALKIRQTHLLPIGAPPESQSAQAEAWTAAAAYGALLHDLGKIAVDVRVELEDGQLWHPWHGPITRPYRFRYVKGREYQLHGAASALVYTQVLDSGILDWLSGFPELWRQLIYLLAGQHEHAGILAEIVVQADKASVAQQLGGNPERALAAPKQSLQRQLADGLRFLVREKLKLNHPDGPSDGWLTQDALWLVSKPAADQLRAYMLTQGIEGVPTSNAPFFNMLQDQAIIQTNAQDKAIWKATIDNGRGWKNNFTFLKISPALVWPNPDDRPEQYGGSLTVDVEQEAAVAPSPAAETVCGVPEDTIDSVAETHQPPLRPRPLVQPGPSEGIQSSEREELLALYSNITEPSEELSASQGSAAAPPPHQGIEEAEAAEDSLAAPARNAALKDVTTMPTSSSLGGNFIAWVKAGIASHKLIINDTKALIHTVDDTAMLVTPGIFKRYVLEHPDLEKSAGKPGTAAWQQVQRAFEKEKTHQKTNKQLNIWTYDVIGPRKTTQLRGYLILDPKLLFAEQPMNNPSLRRVTEGAAE